MRTALLVLLGCCVACATAQQPPAAPDPCATFGTMVVPEADRPTLADARSAGAPCSPFDLYYATDVPDHFRKARFCGLAQLGTFRAGTDPASAKTLQSAAAGGATDPADLGETDGLALAMLFANGEGVTHDARVAKSLVCQFGYDSPEADNRKEANLLRSLERGNRFDLCGADQQPQGRSAWYACDGVELGRTEREITLAQVAAERASVAANKPALRALEAAWTAFSAAENSSFDANCDGGTGCGVFDEENALALNKAWLAKLRIFTTGTLPEDLPAASAYPDADNDLNAAYRRAMTNARNADESHIEARSVGTTKVAIAQRDAGRAWLQYREAWVRLAAKRWPEVPADRWRAWLTVEWTGALQG